MIEIQSSCIDAYDYNIKSKKLLIRFRNSQKYYLYNNIDTDTIDFIFKNEEFTIGKAYSLCKGKMGTSRKPTDKELLVYLL